MARKRSLRDEFRLGRFFSWQCQLETRVHADSEEEGDTLWGMNNEQNGSGGNLHVCGCSLVR